MRLHVAERLRYGYVCLCRMYIIIETNFRQSQRKKGKSPTHIPFSNQISIFASGIVGVAWMDDGTNRQNEGRKRVTRANVKELCACERVCVLWTVWASGKFTVFRCNLPLKIFSRKIVISFCGM